MTETREQCREHIAKVAAAALQARSEGSAASTTGLTTAIAEGRGDRAAIGELSRRTFGTVSPLDLVRFDTDRISSYVFESSRPPVLSGASRILRELNAEIAHAYRDQVIFSAGGEGLLLLPSGRGPEVCAEIERRFEVATAGALGVTTASISVSPEDFLAAPGEEASPQAGVRLAAGTSAVLARLHDRVRALKESRLPLRRSIAGGSERCVSCRDREAGSAVSPRQAKDGTPEGRLCEPCKRRWDAGRELIEGTSFDDIVAAYEQAVGGEGARGGKTRYLGFLYADGNAMGRLFGGLASLTDLRFASQAVSKVFERAGERAKKDVERIVPAKKVLLSLLGGGDEAIWILPGALALHIAEKLDAWVSEEVGRIPGFQAFLASAGIARLTFGAGLVLCDHGYPVRYQHELASALLKSAKSMFQGKPRDEVASSFDFEVLTESSPLSEDLEATRALTYRSEERGFLRTCRPYTCTELGQLTSRARSAQRAGLGKSQLYTLQEGAVEGRKIFLNSLRYQLARMPAAERYEAWLTRSVVADPARIEQFFISERAGKEGRHRGVWIPDLLQLAPFLGSLEREGKG